MARGKYSQIADSDAQAVADEKLRISFDHIDWDTEEFFFHGMEASYYQKFFTCITEIKKCREKEIAEQNHPSLSPKSIFNTSTSIKDSFPAGVINKIKEKLFVETRDEDESKAKAAEIAKRAFEISLSKSYGRLHGFIWNNTFHVVWFDPAHNLYPMKYGITQHRDAATVKCFSPEEALRLQEKIKELQEEYNELYQTFADS